MLLRVLCLNCRLHRAVVSSALTGQAAKSSVLLCAYETGLRAGRSMTQQHAWNPNAGYRAQLCNCALCSKGYRRPATADPGSWAGSAGVAGAKSASLASIHRAPRTGSIADCTRRRESDPAGFPDLAQSADLESAREGREPLTNSVARILRTGLWPRLSLGTTVLRPAVHIPR